MEGGGKVERVSKSVDIDIGHAVFMRCAWRYLNVGGQNERQSF